MLHKGKRQRGFTLTELLMVLTVITLLAALVIPRYTTARDKGAYLACTENLISLNNALNSFANEHEHKYPDSMSDLVPKYISSMPTCPNAAKDSYSESYSKNDLPTTFTIYCSGENHLNIVPVGNQPYYIFGLGLGP